MSLWVEWSVVQNVAHLSSRRRAGGTDAGLDTKRYPEGEGTLNAVRLDDLDSQALTCVYISPCRRIPNLNALCNSGGSGSKEEDSV